MTDPSLILDETGTILEGVEDKSITSISIPDSVTEIGRGVFEDCTSLQIVDIPNSVTEIGDYAFYGCTSLQSIDIPNSVTKIGGSAFSGCTSLQSIDIPNSVTDIGRAAFSGCASLQAIDIPNSVTEIGPEAFRNCTSLKKLYCQIKSLNNVYINDRAFDSSHFDSATLFVPPGTRWEYRHHPVFGKFKNIEIASRRDGTE